MAYSSLGVSSLHPVSECYSLPRLLAFCSFSRLLITRWVLLHPVELSKPLILRLCESLAASASSQEGAEPPLSRARSRLVESCGRELAAGRRELAARSLTRCGRSGRILAAVCCGSRSTLQSKYACPFLEVNAWSEFSNSRLSTFSFY